MASDKTTIRSQVVRMLLMANLENLRAEDIAACLHISPSTLRRRLRQERTSYQELLDAVRRQRCEKILQRRWVPGKCMAPRLGFGQPNSFYRAFQKWMGMSYTDYKRKHHGDVGRPRRRKPKPKSKSKPKRKR